MRNKIVTSGCLYSIGEYMYIATEFIVNEIEIESALR